MPLVVGKKKLDPISDIHSFPLLSCMKEYIDQTIQAPLACAPARNVLIPQIATNNSPSV